MRRIHLILVTPFLGTGLVLGAVEAPQASAAPSASRTGETAAAVAPQRTADRALAPASDYSRGYRDGYQDGFADGRNACRRRSIQRFGAAAPTAYDRGYVAGYDSGFSSGCKYARHHGRRG